MRISVHTQPYKPWEDADERAEAVGYELRFLAGPEAACFSGSGGFAVFREGALLARFKGAQERLMWLHARLEGEKDG